MKTVARIVSAALALAAIIAMPFAAPAAAAGPADIQVEGKTAEYQGNPWGPALGQPDAKAWVHVTFGIYNYGGSPSGTIVVLRYCHYNGISGQKWTALQPTTVPSLAQGGSTLVWFDCPKLSGYGLPDKARVTATGANEPAEKINGYNTADLVVPALIGN